MEREGRTADVSEDGPEPVGSVAEEAAKLFGALGEALGGAGSGGLSGQSRLAGHAARALRDVDEHVATGAPECSYCPLCRTIATVRQTTPEVRAHLLTAADALVQAASGWLATVTPDQQPDRPGRSPGVEHIDLDDTGTDLEEDGR
jgi:hypothetical protein